MATEAQDFLQWMADEHGAAPHVRAGVGNLLGILRNIGDEQLGTAERQLLTDLNIYLARTPGAPDPQGYHDVTK